MSRPAPSIDFLLYYLMCVFQHMYLFLLCPLLLNWLYAFKTTWGMKGRCLLLPLACETGQKAIWTPVSVSGLFHTYTVQAGMRAAIKWHVIGHRLPFFFFAKTPLSNELQPQQGSDRVPSIGQKSSQSTQGVRRVVKTQSRTQWDSPLCSPSLMLTHTHTHTHTLSERMHG